MADSSNTPNPAARKLLTVERLRQVLSYDPESGLFTWANHAGAKNAYAGKPAGARTNANRIIIRVDYRIYFAHRLAWLYMTERWPEHQIDHIDGDPSNNRWANLREATPAQNAWNTGRASNNTSGHKGVGWFKQYGMWRAMIRKDGKTHFLGHFHSKEEAIAAYQKAAKELHGEFARLE